MHRQPFALMVSPPALAAAALVFAHNAICSCYDNSNDPIIFDCGFSYG